MKCDMCGWREAKVVVYLIGAERKLRISFPVRLVLEVSVSWVVSPDSQKVRYQLDFSFRKRELPFVDGNGKN